MKAAFTDEEAAMVEMTHLENEDSAYETSDGNDTDDRVFVLSIREAKKYFADEQARICRHTSYTEAQGVMSIADVHTHYVPACNWWPRTPGGNTRHAARVEHAGRIATGGEDVAMWNYGVPPAMWISAEAAP